MQLGKAIAAVVTGGGSGLGAATARALAAKGVKVAVFDLNETEGKRIAKDIGGHFWKCDVASEESASAALAAVHTPQLRCLSSATGAIPERKIAPICISAARIPGHCAGR